MRLDSLKEFIENIFWKIVLPIFQLKWWISNRKERKIFRERQRWEYYLHGYKTCIFYFRNNWKEDICLKPNYFKKPLCKKSANCKYYLFDPLKG